MGVGYKKLTIEEVNNKLLLATGVEGRTILHVEAECGTEEMLQNVWEWAKEKLTTEEIKKKLLLTTDTKGRSAWQLAAEGHT